MTVEEVELTETIVEQLISLSEDWEKENACHGYRKNTLEDIKGNRVFLAIEGDMVVGYLFGHKETTENPNSVCEAGTIFLKLKSCM